MAATATWAKELADDFGFTEAHDLVRKGARRFLEEHGGPLAIRQMIEREGAFDPALHRRMAELGWLGLILPEEHGGTDLGWLAAVLLFEEMGRALVPSPLLPCTLAAAAIDLCGDESHKKRWLESIASGERIATVALCEPNGGVGADAVETAAEPQGDGAWLLRGTKTHVMAGAQASLVVVPAREANGQVGLFVVELPTERAAVEPEACIDLTRPTARLELRGAAGARLGSDDAAALEALLSRGRVLLAAEMVGGTEAVLGQTVTYARERVQFGRAIGSFQAVKHPLVDMMVGLEQARSLVYGAAAALDGGLEGARTLSRMAKALASETYPAAVRKGVQLHGGFGFTWECDVHLWFRRAMWSRPMLGDGAHQRRHLAAAWKGASDGE
jgi:alkylation response protein AidB-like acyl-CoA dehydrogenase